MLSICGEIIKGFVYPEETRNIKNV